MIRENNNKTAESLGAVHAHTHTRVILEDRKSRNDINIVSCDNHYFVDFSRSDACIDFRK